MNGKSLRKRMDKVRILDTLVSPINCKTKCSPAAAFDKLSQIVLSCKNVEQGLCCYNILANYKRLYPNSEYYLKELAIRLAKTVPSIWSKLPNPNLMLWELF